ncbi:DEAD/DEAH box helicase [Ruminiclostridium cellobioparum]|uniref:ATP-dependent RNA helicase CshA n=1 Tax=Ruminiclostridium cellobioparum subsp. termitidis CT1112 TaxID=1195236 RepID=S0FR40_RUMCE|nr:DEAD/DEAH box helicase [Ruminiclostridium cellobioparum]EMS71654.1 DEAD/DEAH box helicase [Ruminiclostridium cellobioparum subsp. termitidis CT1112]
MENLSFKDLNLSNEVQHAIADMGFEEATPIQSQSIPPILEGNDLIGQAQTGTGKTCAFGIPAIEMIQPQIDTIQVLVLCPTRELAIQSSEELRNVLKYKDGIRILPVYGGQPIDRQILALKKRPQIIIGTPGRVMDHMRRRTIKLENLKMIVLDEADEMLNMGFREDIDTILEKVPEDRQTILFSATMPKEILDITRKYQKDPVHIKVAHKQLTVPSIEQYYLEVKESAKLEVLSRLIDTNDIKLSLVFCNTKKRVDDLTSSLQSRGFSAEALHGDMRQEHRDKVMSQFRKGNFDILIATDVAARGIDVDDVEAVFNYDIPSDEEYYVHRIGRTGRAGRTGKAFTFISGREIYKLRDIQRYTKSTVSLIKPPTINDVEEKKMSNVLNLLKENLGHEGLSKYLSHIERFVNTINSDTEDQDDSFVTSLDVAAALLKMYTEQSGNFPNTVSEIDETSDFDSDSGNDMVRLFINIGSENKIQPKHIIEGLVESSGLPGKMVGSIDIFDRYSFVEVPKEFAAEVLRSMKNHTIKGKRINIEKSTPRKKAGRSSSGFGRNSGTYNTFTGHGGGNGGQGPKRKSGHPGFKAAGGKSYRKDR